MLNIGDRAPGFTLKDKNGNDVKLSDFIGKRVVLPRIIPPAAQDRHVPLQVHTRSFRKEE